MIVTSEQLNTIWKFIIEFTNQFRNQIVFPTFSHLQVITGMSLCRSYPMALNLTYIVFIIPIGIIKKMCRTAHRVKRLQF